MKNISIVVIIILLLVIAYLLFYRDINKGCYKLPVDHNPRVFGKYYWAAIHDISNRIPCPSCREEGQELFVFAHDLINYKLSKPIWDEGNFNKWINKIVEIKKEREKI